jgi:hypothetical protein
MSRALVAAAKNSNNAAAEAVDYSSIKISYTLNPKSNAKQQ